jgi:hypothetical protein
LTLVVCPLDDGDVDPAELVRRTGATDVRVASRAMGSLREATKDVSSELVLVAEEGIVPESDDWLANLTVHAEQDDVAAVAPVVLGSAGPWVEDAGLIVGLDGGVGPAMTGWNVEDDGYAGSLSCAREVSAVSGTCVVIAAATLDRLGGFSELYATPALACVDLSLRARAAGLRNVVTPRALVRRGVDPSAAADDPLDRLLLHDAWAETLAAPDPYHNPGFTAAPGGYGR